MPVNAIAFGSPVRKDRTLDDADMPQSVDWRKSGDQKLIESARAGDVAGFCKGLRRGLSHRRAGGKRARASRSTLPRILQPLWSQYAWADPTTTEQLSGLLTDLQRRLSKREKSAKRFSSAASKRVTACLKTAPPETSPWAQVVWLTILSESAEVIDDQTLLAVWRQTLESVVSLSDVDAAQTAGCHVEFADDRQLLLCGELPWLAGLVFANVKGAGKLQRAGRTELRKQLEEFTDRDGSPHARALHRLPLTLAVLTRSLSAGEKFGETLFGKASSKRFGKLLTRTAVMVQAGGRLALSNGASFETGSLLRTASTLADLTPSTPPVRRLQELIGDPRPDGSALSSQVARLPKVRSRRPGKNVKRPSSQSDWAELACMRNNWRAGGDSCIIAHHDALPQLSVTAFERTLIDGDWDMSIEVDGKPIDIAGDWSCVCWFSDDDADYAELQLEMDGGLTLQRQVLLSRTDHWLMLADNVNVADNVNASAAPLQMTSRLPFAEEVTLEDNRWTRDIALQCGKLKARAIPLALQQERVQRADGSLTIDGSELVITQSSTGGALQMPLVLDWSPDRQQDELQWRQLTIAEDGQTLPRHVAVGQRLRIGKHQWLFYRSHQPTELGRSVLGHHTQHETVIGEFNGQGEVEPIVLVESSPAPVD